jgi:RES domain-containing protein
MATAWRIVKTKHVTGAFDGIGARRSGGRWNSVGVSVVYLSESISLALLEIIVHLDDSGVLPAYSLFEVTIPPRLIEVLDRSALPPDWRETPPPPELAVIGDAWVAGQRSVALEIPSAVVPTESNYLLNPNHPDFPSITIGPARPYPFDERLVKV